MSGSGDRRSFGDTARAAAAAVAILPVLGTTNPATVADASIDPAAEHVTMSAPAELADDGAQLAEVAADAIRQHDDVESKTEPLPDDPPGEYRDAEPDPFGAEYTRDAEAFAMEGDVDAAADGAPDAAVDLGPDIGDWGGVA